MAEATLTLTQIGVAAASRADMVRTDPASGLIELVESVEPSGLLLAVNHELAVLWDVMISTYEDYCIKHKIIEVVANTQEYSMPSDFYKFRKIFPIQNGRRYAPLRKFDLRELGEADTFAAILARPIEYARYSVKGNRLWLHPMPSNAGQLELWYVPQFDPIINLNDKIDFRFPFGWDQYVIEGVAAMLLEREESDGSAQRSRQKEILQRILIMAEDRDVGQPHQMQDTEGYIDDWGYRDGN